MTVKYARLEIGEYYDYPDRELSFERVKKSVNAAERRYGVQYKVHSNKRNTLRVTRIA